MRDFKIFRLHTKLVMVHLIEEGRADNLLRDDETRVGYFLLRMRYKIELLLTNKNK